MRRGGAALLLLAAAACGDDLAPLRATASALEVTSRGVREERFDLHLDEVAAHQRDGTRIDGGGDEDGEIWFDQAFALPAVLSISGFREWYAIERRELAIRLPRAGRLDATWRARDDATTLTLEVTGLSPWTVDDQLEVFSPDAGCAYEVIWANYLEVGATTASIALGGDALGAICLTEASRGDQAFLVQRTRGGDLTRWAPLELEQRAGEATAAAVALRPVEVDGGVQVEPDGPAFAAAYQPGFGGDGDAVATDVFLVGGPGDDLSPYVVTTVVAARRASDSVPFDGSPVVFDLPTLFDRDWLGLVATHRVAVLPPYRHTEARLAFRVRPAVTVSLGLDDVVAWDGRPLLSTARGATIGGCGFAEPRCVVSDAPVVAWQPPAEGRAAQYVLQLYAMRYHGDGADRVMTYEHVRSIHVLDGTSVRLPRGLLEAGTDYFVLLSAQTAPFVRPLAHADILSGRIELAP